MKALDSLIQTLSKHFSMHPSRQKTFVGMILGAMSSSNCQHHSLSRHVDSPNQQSAVRRVERFFQEQELSCEQGAKALVDILQFEGKFDLCLDRSNWQFGTKNINYLVLSWQISKDLSVPLLFVDLDKAGNSNTNERIDLLEIFDRIFGCSRIKTLLADREFIGEKWICFLASRDIPFYIRIRENTLLPFSKDPLPAKDFFYHLTQQTQRLLIKELYGHTFYFAGTRSPDGELVIVMTNQNQTAKKILKIYRSRWSIEILFKNLKSSGFNWESTHMKITERLVKLLVILTLATLCSCLMGIRHKIPWKKTLNCPVKTMFRQGLQSFQHLISKGVNLAIKQLLKVLNHSYFGEFLKSDG
jgi:hypothetical protein